MSQKSGAVTLTAIFALNFVFSVGFFFAITRSAMAENVLEFPFPEVVDPAKRASAKLLDAASTCLHAMRLAELGDFDGANGQMREASSALDQSESDFGAVAAKLKGGDRRINYSKAPKDIDGQTVEQIFNRVGVRPPITVEDLAYLALNEVIIFRKAALELKFGAKGASRAAVSRFGVALQRALSVGVAISTLADTAL